MNEDPTVRTEPSERQRDDEAWREVGRQFEALGKSLSRAFRAAWERKETQQHVRSMQDGLEKMVREVSRAVKEASESYQAERVRAEAEKAAGSLRRVGQRTWQETRPQLVSALTTLNSELQRLIDDLEQKPAPGPQTPKRQSSEGEARSPSSDPEA